MHDILGKRKRIMDGRSRKDCVPLIFYVTNPICVNNKIIKSNTTIY